MQSCNRMIHHVTSSKSRDITKIMQISSTLPVIIHRLCSSAGSYNYDILKERAVGDVPVITMPVHLERKARKLRQKKLERQLRYEQEYGVNPNKSKRIIESKDKKTYHYENQRYPPNKPLPLASQHWLNKRYDGSTVTIRNTCSKNPSLITGKYEEAESFDGLDLCPEIKSILTRNFSTMTNVQRLAIPLILAGRNLILAAETGSGKTLAYMAPLIHKLNFIRQKFGPPPKSACPRALIFAPNRQLGQQIFDVLREYTSKTDLQCSQIQSGSIYPAALDTCSDIVVATPGVVDRLKRANMIHLTSLSHVILDEADTLLDDTFRQTLTDILQDVPFRISSSSGSSAVPHCAADNKSTQLILVSATFPENLDGFLAGLPELDHFERVRTKNLHALPPQITHTFIRCRKTNLVEHMLTLAKQETKSRRNCLVFVENNNSGTFLFRLLQSSNIPCAFLHRDQSAQGIARAQRVLDDFKRERCRFLLATDLGSRGLDTSVAQHVINYHFPRTLCDYLHRAGRLGRVGSRYAGGHVTSFVTERGDVEYVQRIETAVRLNRKLPDIFMDIKKEYAQNLERSYHDVEGRAADEDAEEFAEDFEKFGTVAENAE